MIPLLDSVLSVHMNMATFFAFWCHYPLRVHRKCTFRTRSGRRCCLQTRPAFYSRGSDFVRAFRRTGRSRLSNARRIRNWRCGRSCDVVHERYHCKVVSYLKKKTLLQRLPLCRRHNRAVVVQRRHNNRQRVKTQYFKSRDRFLQALEMLPRFLMWGSGFPSASS